MDNQTFSVFNIFRRYAIILVLLFCMGIFGIINPKFFSTVNMLNIFWQNSYLVVATLGMAYLLISGNVDLAAGIELSFGAVIAAACLSWWNLPIWVAVLAGILTCVVLSTLNGIFTIKLKIHSLMVTLATMTIYLGIANIFSGQKAIFGLPASFKYIGQGSLFEIIPIPAIIMVLLVGLASFILNFTYLGRFIFAVGGNPEAARLAGIKVNQVRLIVFVLAGFFFGVGAILLVARTGAATTSIAAGSEFTCLTAALLGGVAIQGGEGKLWSVVVSVFILGILANGMQLIGLGAFAQYIAKGAILLLALGFDTYQKAKSVKSLIIS